MNNPYEQIEAFQKLPYIVLKHEGKYYKCYELKELNVNSYEAIDTKPKETEWITKPKETE